MACCPERDEVRRVDAGPKELDAEAREYLAAQSFDVASAAEPDQPRHLL